MLNELSRVAQRAEDKLWNEAKMFVEIGAEATAERRYADGVGATQMWLVHADGQSYGPFAIANKDADAHDWTLKAEGIVQAMMVLFDWSTSEWYERLDALRDHARAEVDARLAHLHRTGERMSASTLHVRVVLSDPAEAEGEAWSVAPVYGDTPATPAG